MDQPNGGGLDALEESNKLNPCSRGLPANSVLLSTLLHTSLPGIYTSEESHVQSEEDR